VIVTDRAPAYLSLTPANVQVISARDLTKSACCNLAESFETNASVKVTTSDAVVNGYEAISGQVSVKLKEPDKMDQLLFSAYGNDLGKFDVNLNASARINPKWSTVLLLHSDHLGIRVDRNKDGFLDLPLATQLNAFNK